MRLALVLGTRPEIIKMSPVVRECRRQGLGFFILHTGQHYAYNMDRVFFQQLGLPEAAYNLDVGSGTHAEQTGKMLMGIERILLDERPDIVLVEGDTNSVLAGALAACKLGIKVGHVEAGLRSYDRRMPEEVNRVLADHCSSYLFAPTERSRQILLGEGLPEQTVYMTGNTIVDAVNQNLQVAEEKGDALGTLGLSPQGYFLATVHRQENVDDEARFSSILRGLELVAESFNTSVVYPVHPRAKKTLERFQLGSTLRMIDATDFLSFLQLERGAGLILTDSGGVQEEACILGVPCVTLRDNTERPETVEVGANRIAGTSAEGILNAARVMLSARRGWRHPFGDGRAAEHIVEIARNNEQCLL